MVDIRSWNARRRGFYVDFATRRCFFFLHTALSIITVIALSCKKKARFLPFPFRVLFTRGRTRRWKPVGIPRITRREYTRRRQQCYDRIPAFVSASDVAFPEDNSAVLQSASTRNPGPIAISFTTSRSTRNFRLDSRNPENRRGVPTIIPLLRKKWDTILQTVG